MGWSRVSSLVLTSHNASESFSFWYWMCELVENCLQISMNTKFERFWGFLTLFRGVSEALEVAVRASFEQVWELRQPVRSLLDQHSSVCGSTAWFLMDFGAVFGSQNRWKNESELLENLRRFSALICNTLLNSFGIEHKVSNTSFHLSDKDCGSRLWTLWDV